MHIVALTLDDLLNKVFKSLLDKPFDIKPSRSSDLGPTSEILGVMLNLKNPRARLSRDEVKGTIFSALGELLWYLSKDNDLNFIKYYIKRYENESEDGKTIYGGYGPRLFNFKNSTNQIQNIIDLLKRKPLSRRAVIQIFDSEDLNNDHIEIPCTCTLQFFVRDNKLSMYTSMRSNDAYVGLPHDVFAFTLLQEIIARSLNLDVGEYYHAVGSLHIYQKNKSSVEEYLASGYHSTNYIMPPMPINDLWNNIETLLMVEKDLRVYGSSDDSENYLSDPYWNDFRNLLKAYSIFKSKALNASDVSNLDVIRKNLSTNVYDIYIEKKILEKKIL